MLTYVPELLNVEWEQEIAQEFCSSSNKESLNLLLESLTGPVSKEIADKIGHLHLLAPKEQEQQFILIRRSLIETAAGLTLYLNSHPHKSEDPFIQKILSVLSLLQDFLQKTTVLIPSIQQARARRAKKLTLHKTDDTPLSGVDLEKIFSFIERHQEELDEALLSKARSLLIPSNLELPFPLIFSTDGLIYVAAETILVGSGRGKQVFKIMELTSGEALALVRPLQPTVQDPNHEQESFYNRLNIWKESLFLKKLQGCKGVIQIHDLFMYKIQKKVEIFEIMELFGSEDLSSLLRKRKKSNIPLLSRGDEAKVAHDILKGLEGIHQREVLHRDLKPANILVQRSSTKPPKAKIIDFNFACFRHDSAEKNKVCFHAYYCAPEYARVLIETDFKQADPLWSVTTEKIDIWNMGCILYRLFFHSSLPWMFDSPDQIEEAENRVDPEIRRSFEAILQLRDNWIDPKFHTHLFYPLVEKMLQIDPVKRLTASDAVLEFERIIDKKNHAQHRE
jgi:hypothetical protein